jgi:fructosamine-3-kinase
VSDSVRRLLGVEAVSARPVGGGCISDARRVELADGRIVFVKSGNGLPGDLLACEAAGLRWLAEAGGVRVPRVLAVGMPGDAPVRPDGAGESAGEIAGDGDRDGDGDRWDGPPTLVLEWIEAGPSTAGSRHRLGRGLARLHAAGAEGFGWWRDGFIGSLPQRNTPTAGDWPSFWFTRRIEPLSRQARDRGSLPGDAVPLVSRLGERLAELAGPPEPPARVHGDLWSGNVMADRTGEPWVVDPAPYGGHREVDLAMLHLFGNPGPEVVEAYQEVAPLSGGWRDRLRLWQLEPLLTHTVMFGGGYGEQARQVLRRFAA